jgi:hypothetical protein
MRRQLIPLYEKKEIPFPYEVISGAAMAFVELYSYVMEPPKQFWYMSFLTCLGSFLSPSISIDTEIYVQPRLFVVLLGNTALTRKSTAMRKTVELFRRFPFFKYAKGYGSGEALADSLMENQNLLLYHDEFQRMIHKSMATGGSYLDIVFELFDSNDWDNRLRDEKRSIVLEDVHLSLIAASSPMRFERVFNSNQVDYDFLNRLFLVPGESKLKNPIPETITPKLKLLLTDYILSACLAAKIGFLEKGMAVDDGLVYSFEPDAYAMFEEWYMHKLGKLSVNERTDTYALRLMPLLALNDSKWEIDVETVEKALKLVNWQSKVRRLYEPIFLSSKSAQLQEKILRDLEEAGKGGLSDGRLKNSRSVSWRKKTSPEEYDRAMKVLREKRFIKSYEKNATTYHEVL